MRDDIAHRFDRIYRDTRKGSNDAFLDGCQGYRAAHYDLARDTFYTGRTESGRVNLREALDQARKAVGILCAAAPKSTGTGP